jgi:hypothetical protein
MIEWLRQNEVLSGLAAVVLAGLGFLIKRWVFGEGQRSASDGVLQPAVTINNTNVQHTPGGTTGIQPAAAIRSRAHIRILFIDDDTRFKVVKIMKQAGWPNVQIKKDIKDLEEPDVKDSDVFFIDIHGVGRALDFADGGLGLTLAIKNKYPEKKVVLYSAQTDGDRFHKALKKADGSLPKNSEPYEFITLLEQLTGV